MKLGRNLAAGAASSLFSAVVGIAVVPLYLRFLGVEAYGLIGFFVTTQAMFQLLDLGLAQTLNREISRFSVNANWQQAGNLLHTLAVIYWSVALFIAVIVFLLSSWIAQHWIQADRMSATTVQLSIQLIGVAIACRWPVGLYQGALIGLQLNTITSAVAMVMTALGSGGAVLLLAFVSPRIESFFIWQALVGVLYALTLRRYAWRNIRPDNAPRFDGAELRRIWKFATGVAVIALSAVVFTQLDKVVLSKVLSLEEFGFYMLATVISGGLYLLAAPLFNVIYPRFSILIANGSEAELRQLYRLGTRLFATVLFPLAFTLAAFSRELVLVWTGDESIAMSVAPVLSVMCVGTALHGVMFFPYALQLAYGLPRLALKINALLMVIFVPLIITLASRYGAVGGAMAWLILHVSYVLVGTWLTHRTLLRGTGISWLTKDVAASFAVAASVVLLAHYLLNRIAPSGILALFFAAVTALASIGVGLLSKPQDCQAVLAYFRASRRTV